MTLRYPPSPLRLVVLVLIATLCATVHSQEIDKEENEKSPILLRVLCKQPVSGATDLKIVQEQEVLHDLTITASLMTEPLSIKRGELLLAHPGGESENPSFNPILKVSIPAEGKRFVLALFASPNPTPAKPYQFRLIRTDGLRFGASDLYMFNLTTLPIGGVLGKEKFSLAPDAFDVVRPKPDEVGGRMYQSRFYCKIGDQVKLFNDTRWPLALSARVYLFFIPDPERQSIGYLSFREYEPFP